jgi:hypothetical protein
VYTTKIIEGTQFLSNTNKSMIYYINHEYTTKIIESTQFLSNPTKSMVYYINHDYTTKIIEGRRFLSNPTKSMVHYINHVYTTKMHRRYYTISVLYCSVYHIKINILLCDIINRILLLYIAVVSGIGRYSEQGYLSGNDCFVIKIV